LKKQILEFELHHYSLTDDTLYLQLSVIALLYGDLAM